MNPLPARSHSSALEKFLRGFGRLLFGSIYRVAAHGLENLPPGGFLLLPNHLTWVDAIVLQLACPRPIRFIVFESFYHHRALHPFLRAVQAIPISPTKAKEAVRLAGERMRQGEIVCLFPEGELSRSGILLRLKRGYELMARAADAPVVPVWLDQLWGSIFSFKGGRFFSKVPQQFPYPVTVAFGEPLAPEKADIAMVRQRFLELGEWCYQQRPHLRGHLGESCLRGLKRHQWETAVVDGLDHSTMSRGMLLAAAIALRREVRALCPGRRVAVVLPPGKGAILANLAVVLAAKVPVNLNFTAGPTAIAAAIRIAQIEHVFTAGKVEKKLRDFPWPKHVHRLDELIPPLKKRIGLWRALVACLPAAMLARMIGLPRHGDREEAVLLFTSGSSGDPKGVVLSHRNILGNVSQFGLMLNLSSRDSILASLPFFHSFGSTVTLWYPLIERVRTVTYPTPLEVGKNAELIERYGVTVLLATPTFLRGYLRKAEEAQLAALQLIVVGAEKLPQDLAEAFEEKFGRKVMEGYGLTETSPVASVNLPEPAKRRPQDAVQPSSRPGSAGKLAPGVAAHIRDPETGEMRSLHESGMLWLRGPNIFEGYLDEPDRTAEVLQDGWFRTGDLGRFDEDGFLYIEGRLSRFSKVAGEMVPHETVETKINEALEIPSGADREIVILGVPDEARGEALVLLSTREIDLPTLRTKLGENGVPNLWIPKVVRRIDAIPVLGSGKLDLKTCKELAEASA